MMHNLNENIINDEEIRTQIWDLYGELLDNYFEHNFCAKELAHVLNKDKKTINKIMHRLLFYKAIKCVGCNVWGAKIYMLNEDFRN